MTTIQKGNLSTIKCAAALMAAGYSVALPIGDGSVYDLIYEVGDSLQKVQVKSGVLSNGVVVFYPKGNNGRWYNRSVGNRNYHGKVDAICVYCPTNEGVYLVPISEVGTSATTLRIAPTKNGNAKKVRWAKDYEIRPRREGSLALSVGGSSGDDSSL